MGVWKKSINLSNFSMGFDVNQIFLLAPFDNGGAAVGLIMILMMMLMMLMMMLV